MSNASKQDPSERLKNRLGFDAGKSPSLSSDILSEAITELKAERDKTALENAKVLLKKAMELRTQKVKAEREFQKQTQAFDKQLGKIMNQIENGLNGADVRPEVEDGEVVENDPEASQPVDDAPNADA